MKNHAIIPVFLPHEGCPHDCIFCNQRAITARQQSPSPEQVRATIEQYLPTIAAAGVAAANTEIAFFGGSFTGLPMEAQREYLTVAREYKGAGRVGKIRLSTRPDYIDAAILGQLQEYNVDIIELGVQSFDDEVLALSRRGHDSAVVYESCAQIRKAGFTLGIQLMIGLPGDSYEKSLFSAREAAGLRPAMARLYPTVVLPDTGLHRLYAEGRYRPLSTEEAVRTAKDMYLVLQEAGVFILRVGLKSTDLIGGAGSLAEAGYHPTFRQLVEGAIAREQMEAALAALLTAPAIPPSAPADPAPATAPHAPTTKAVTFLSNGFSFSNMTGHQNSNRLYFAEKYPHIRFSYRRDDSLPNYHYAARLEP